MGYRSIVTDPVSDVDLTGSRITRREWNEFAARYIEGGLGDNLDLYTEFVLENGIGSEQVLVTLKVTRKDGEPYKTYELYEQMEALRRLLVDHGVRRFSIEVTRYGESDVIDLDVEKIRITQDGFFRKGAVYITFTDWEEVESDHLDQ